MPAIEISTVTADACPDEGSPESLKRFAHQLASDHRQVTLQAVDRQSLDQLESQKKSLDQAYSHFRQQAQDDLLFMQAGEWLLDNYYVVSSALQQIEQDMPREFYRQLPRLEVGEWRDYPRVYLLARELLACQTQHVDLDWVRQFVTTYQEITPLTMGELWALPTMLRYGFIEKLIQTLEPLSDQAGKGPAIVIEAGNNIDDTNVAWCILGLRLLDTQNWYRFFEKVSLVDRVLGQDPAGAYLDMDFATRDSYRKVVERLSWATSLEEVAVAGQAVQLAGRTRTDGMTPGTACENHVGYYLVGDGLCQLEQKLAYQPPRQIRLRRWFLQSHPAFLYLGSVTCLTLFSFLFLWVYLWYVNSSPQAFWVAGVLLLIPLFSVAISQATWLMTQLVKPRVLPKIAFEDGIPDSCRTMIVVPSLLGDEAEVSTLLQQVELHYLSNNDANITFALLTDFCDAPQQKMPTDELFLTLVVQGIQRLNQKYGHPPDKGPFYLFHRQRLWNPEEGCWMGWERKRGKLEEFNRLLLGKGTTSYTVQIGHMDILPQIRYVITLDVDNTLPQNQAPVLIGTLAHPLNQARLDPQTGTITRGYTVLQPRVEIKPSSSNQTLFSRLFGGNSGLDLYCQAVSDMYQDLFGEGIYMGKGIYEVSTFDKCLAGRAPKNWLVSHDLFEGIYGRAALVSDVIVYEEYPPIYQVHTRRKHRWIRGDWQLLPWLMPKVPHLQAGKIQNELSIIDRWKIVDNLRRSLLRPTLMLLLVAGWLWLPGSPLVWTLVVCLILASDVFISLIDVLVHSQKNKVQFHFGETVQRPLSRWLFELITLPHESLIEGDAILTAFVRMYVTHKRLLQWTTAAHTVQLLGKNQSIAVVWREMSATSVLAVMLALLIGLLNPTALLVAAPLLLIWLAGPLIIMWINKPLRKAGQPLSPDQKKQLHCLARRTWFFYEQFIGPEDHWLAPDHFQEDPRGLIAHRTSPTNIGLTLLTTLAAYDLGYIGLPELQVRLTSTLDGMDQLEKYRGHFLNWYDTRTLMPLPPRYISTVDSGNLACCLVALRQGCLALPDNCLPRREQRQGVIDTLAVLSETLAGLVKSAPDSVRALQQRLEGIAEQVQTVGDDPLHWSALMKRLQNDVWPTVDQDLVNLLGGETSKRAAIHSVRVWSDRAHHQLFDVQRKFHMLIPWLVFIPEAPSLLQAPQIDPSLAAAWQSLIEELPLTGIACREIPAICLNAQNQLDQLLLLLPKELGMPEQVQQARQWCKDFKQALVAAEAEISKIISAFEDISHRIEELITEMHFAFLYDPDRGVFHIGYNVDIESQDANYYDLLASEARLASLLAIAKGDVPERHWLCLGRPLKQVEGRPLLLSWSGTMFEYLMPSLLTRQTSETLLNQSIYGCIEQQITYGRRKGVPWGNSESGYYAFDASLNYQYRAFGTPGLGFKRGLEDDLVVSPYSTVLALPFQPKAVMDNIARLIEMDMLGDYGFYEAVDFTRSRLTLGQEWAVVRSFMVHHQGMIMLSLVNTLQDKPMVRRFHADPQVRSVELLLQERLPVGAPETIISQEEETLARLEQPKIASMAWRVPENTAFPVAHYLANGRFGVLITNAGGGYSRWKDIDLTRWRADTTRDDWGTWIYIQDADSGQLWSATPQPTNSPKHHWEINYSPQQADFHCTGLGISTHLQITVPPDDDLEIRRLRVTNHSRHRRRLAITSYGEVVLGGQDSDRRHPAFNKLFIESEYHPDNRTLLFRRRPRTAEEQARYLAHSLILEPDKQFQVEYETDRAYFLGRGGSPRQPAALRAIGGGLSGASGAVLDAIMCLQVRLEIEPNSTREVTFLTLAGTSREDLLSIVARYLAPGHVHSAFGRALAKSELYLRQLNLSSEELEHFQELFSLLTFPHASLRQSPQILAQNRLGQSALWPYAISGDLPILLISLANDAELGLLAELLQAHRYWRHQGLQIDLIVLNEQGISYDATLQNQLYRMLRRMHCDNWLNRRGGIFVVQADRLSNDEKSLFAAAARVMLHGRAGSLPQQLSDIYRPATRPPVFVPPRISQPLEPVPPLLRPEHLLNDNGWGGFSTDGREYCIYLRTGERTPAPWVNVISNPGFGFLVSEMGSSFSWALNSGENRLTPWYNDPVCDPSGEALYVRDRVTNTLWSPTPQPLPANSPYLVRHGAGYTKFEHHSHGLKQELRMFVDADAPVKLICLRLENTLSQSRMLSVTYYCEWVLGVNRDQTQQYLIPEYDSQTGALLARQPYQAEFGSREAFLAASQHPDGLTADRTEFLGRLGDLSRPAALKRVGLTGHVEAGADPCAALKLYVDLEAGETKEIYFMLGQGTDRQEALALIKRFQDRAQVKAAWKAVQVKWDKLLGVVQVETPDEQMDLMLNRWLLYQNLSCRIWGRSGFYQSSGAFGFRDQLQDVMATLHAAPEIARQQILRAGGRQFEDGDVLHWWHPPSGRGVRTRISDDLLWLPYVTAEYVSCTQDEAILHEPLSFLQGPILAEGEEERYGHYKPVEERTSLYDHCCRAIEHACRYGDHGLPLIGAGDWNDGLNRVGIAGRGESVWLGWFIYATLARFLPICRRLDDQGRVEQYYRRMAELRMAIEEHGWDGEWYLRGYYDDGHSLGSRRNQEYRISSIAQSWSVLSGASDGQRAQQAINALWRHLVRPEEQLVLLFTPPFDQNNRDPGYIKGYPPGIRENGGQYTHAASWAGWASACLGRGSDAYRIFQMLNPISHADTAAKAQLYRVEPYVVAADIYSVPPHTGQGGWTWYTGSAGWLYRLGLEAILGLRREGQLLHLAPCIPELWPSFRIQYQVGEAVYQIEVLNPERRNRGVKEVYLDGQTISDGLITLVDDGQEHQVQVLMGI
ncbi:MAG: GH36-type glycosyl hydrolase domain-containing protein [Candidatus Promineifilaceae bacterium]